MSLTGNSRARRVFYERRMASTENMDISGLYYNPYKKIEHKKSFTQQTLGTQILLNKPSHNDDTWAGQNYPKTD